MHMIEVLNELAIKNYNLCASNLRIYGKQHFLREYYAWLSECNTASHIAVIVNNYVCTRMYILPLPHLLHMSEKKKDFSLLI